MAKKSLMKDWIPIAYGDRGDAEYEPEYTELPGAKQLPKKKKGLKKTIDERMEKIKAQ